MTTITRFDQVPAGTTYIALENAKVHIPGDERSRTNPGHGYPAHDHEYLTVTCFRSATELKSWLAAPGRGKCAIFSVQPLRYEVQHVANVDLTDDVAAICS